MEATEKAIKGIDFKLLRKQKNELLETLTFLEDNVQYDDDEDAKVMRSRIDSLEGILNMIDAIQDAVVKDGIKTERQVFGKLD